MTWAVWTQFHGETHGVGLWVTIEAVSNAEGKGAPLTNIENLPMLIRWECILGGKRDVAEYLATLMRRKMPNDPRPYICLPDTVDPRGPKGK